MTSKLLKPYEGPGKGRACAPGESEVECPACGHKWYPRKPLKARKVISCPSCFKRLAA